MIEVFVGEADRTKESDPENCGEIPAGNSGGWGTRRKFQGKSKIGGVV